MCQVPEPEAAPPPKKRVLPALAGPLDLSTYSADINLNHPWLKRIDGKERIYFVNVESKQSSWEVPEEWQEEEAEEQDEQEEVATAHCLCVFLV